MSISPVSNAAPAIQAGQAAKVAPFKRDRDGDYDNTGRNTAVGSRRGVERRTTAQHQGLIGTPRGIRGYSVTIRDGPACPIGARAFVRDRSWPVRLPF